MVRPRTFGLLPGSISMSSVCTGISQSMPLSVSSSAPSTSKLHKSSFSMPAFLSMWPIGLQGTLVARIFSFCTRSVVSFSAEPLPAAHASPFGMAKLSWRKSAHDALPNAMSSGRWTSSFGRHAGCGSTSKPRQPRL